MRSCLALMFLFACGSDPKAVSDAGMDAGMDAAMNDTGPAAVNGCQAAQAVDRTAAGASRTITFDDSLIYTPRCLKIAVGQSVTFSGSFGNHPLRAGIVRSGANPMAQTGNPVPNVDTGASQMVTFATAGDWAYYCTAHQPGMAGVVYVVTP
jgi:plastocyanin